MNRDRRGEPSRATAGGPQRATPTPIGKTTLTQLLLEPSPPLRHLDVGNPAAGESAAGQRQAARPSVDIAALFGRPGTAGGAPVQCKAASPLSAFDDQAVPEIAAQGVTGTGAALPHLTQIQASFGHHDVSGVRAHQGPAAFAAARDLGADAYAVGNSVAFAGAPDLHTAAHEAAHVVQQRRGVQLKGGIDQPGDAYERHADAVADAVVAGRSAEALLDQHASGTGTTGAVQRKLHDDTKVLENQASLKSTDVEIPALEGALLSTRLEAVKKGLLSKQAFDASLDLSKAMTQLQPAAVARGAIDVGLQEQAALAAQLLFMALQRETADDKNFHAVPTMGLGGEAGITEQNPYTEQVRVTTSFLVWSRTHESAGWLAQLPGLIRQHQWEDAFTGYRRLMNGLDLWVADQLRTHGKGTPDEARGNAHLHYAELRTGLEKIADKHAKRLPALFHPAHEIVEKEKAAGRPAVETVPMNVYLWKDAADGKVHIHDLTTPSRPHEQVIDGEPTAATMNTFFEEVARYPEGEVRYTLPGGAGGAAPTTGKTKWYEWVGYAGLAIAAVGLALLTAGASIPATVCFAAGTVAGGVSAGGHLVDTTRLGTATTATVVLDVAQIAASFASFGAMSLTVKAGSAAAALAGSRYFVPLVGGAAAADSVQLVALTDISFAEMSRIQNGPGSPEDKQRAMAVLLTQLIVAGGLTALSVQGARNVRALAGKPLELVDQNGAKVLRLVGDSTTEPATAKTPEKSVAAGSEARSTGNAEPTAEHSSEPEPAKKPTSSSPEHGDANLAAADAEGGPAKWVDERAHMSGDARSYQDTAHGARSNTTTRAPQAPELEYKASDGSIQKVRFDGVDGRVMIDRKKSVTTFPKSERQALRQSEALRQNGLTAVWEVPTDAEAARATKMLSKLGISNITIRVVRP